MTKCKASKKIMPWVIPPTALFKEGMNLFKNIIRSKVNPIKFNVRNTCIQEELMIKVTNKLQWQCLYSSTDKPDKMGRWKRKLIFDNWVNVGVVNRIKYIDTERFQIQTNFPLLKNDSGIYTSYFATQKEAMDRLIELWNDFLKQLDNRIRTV